MSESTASQPAADKSSDTQTLEEFASREYEWGFVTDIEADSAPPGLNEEIIRFISAKKEEPEFMLEWRLKAYRQWLKMEDPTRRAPSERWAKVNYPDIDYQSVVYYSAPKKKELSSLDEVDPPPNGSADGDREKDDTLESPGVHAGPCLPPAGGPGPAPVPG